MSTQWSERSIVRLLAGITTDAVDRNPKVVVRAEALIMAMHAILAVIGMRFSGRTESLREEYFSVMEPYLLAAGLPADRIVDYCNSRFVEYGQLMIEKVKSADSLADFELGCRIAAHVMGSRPEQIVITEANYWLAQYHGLTMGASLTLDRHVLRPSIFHRISNALRVLIRGD